MKRLSLVYVSLLLLAMALWLGRTLIIWGRHVKGIETALADVLTQSRILSFGRAMSPGANPT